MARRRPRGAAQHEAQRPQRRERGGNQLHWGYIVGIVLLAVVLVVTMLPI